MKLKKRLHVMGKALHMELREHKSSFLVYVTLRALVILPFGNFFAIVFFVLLVVAALTTSLTIYQVIICVLVERLRASLREAINLTLGAIFVFGNIPCILAYGPWRDVRILDRNIFDAFDFVSGNICFVLTALGATLFVGWVMKHEALEEIDNGGEMPHKMTGLWYGLVRYAIPLVIIAIFIYGLRGFFA